MAFFSNNRSGLSSAKSYTSSSGTSSGVSSGISTSGSSSGVSSYVSAQSKHTKNFLARVAGLPDYAPDMRRPGDVFFHSEDGEAGHTNMVAADTTKKIDSMDPDGVRRVPMTKDKHTGIVYRFHDPAVAQRAALLADSWVGQVNYSDFAVGSGITFRVLGAVFGSSNFGIGAQARLLKYRNRAGMAPKNVICSEMCILAYQLSMAETDNGFIKLDAKHSTPATLMKYFDGPGSAHWTRIAVKR